MVRSNKSRTMHKAKITKNEKVANDVRKITCKTDKPLEFTAGQFVMVQIPHEEASVERAFSLANPENHSEIVWYVKILPNGVASTFFENCKKGDTISFKPAQGAMTLPETLPNNLVFVATTTGIAPYLSILHKLKENNPNIPVRFLFGCRYKDDDFASCELELLKKDLPNLEYGVCLSRAPQEWEGKRGRVTAHLENIPTENTLFYLCGNKSMIIDARNFLIKKGVNPRDVKFEIFF